MMLDQHRDAAQFVRVLSLLGAAPEGAELFAAVDVGVAEKFLLVNVGYLVVDSPSES